MESVRATPGKIVEVVCIGEDDETFVGAEVAVASQEILDQLARRRKRVST